MNIIVCVKPVPDVNILTLNPKTGLIDSDDLVYIINPYDMAAIEEALCIKEKEDVNHITLVSLAPPSTKRLLRRGLAMGADEAMLIWDNNFDNLDSYATGVILAKAFDSLQYDLILSGQRAIDTEAGQVGSVIAERLDLPLVTRTTSIDIVPESKKAVVQSKLEKGNRVEIEIVLPAVLAVEADLDEPRYASLPSHMAGLRGDIKEYDLAALGLSKQEVAQKETMTRTVGLSTPKPRPKKVFTPDSSLTSEERLRLIMSGGVTQKQGDKLEGDPEKIASSVVQFLIEKKIVSKTK
jgi:electron transfer flavoprotein beta subunit